MCGRSVVIGIACFGMLSSMPLLIVKAFDYLFWLNSNVRISKILTKKAQTLKYHWDKLRKSTNSKAEINEYIIIIKKTIKKLFKKKRKKKKSSL